MSDRPSPAVIAALNGSLFGRAQLPAGPLTTAELAAEARRCAEAGATYVVLVPRTDTGAPSRDSAAIRATVDAVRAASGLPIALSLLDYDADLAARRTTLLGRAELVEIPVGAPRRVAFDPSVSAFGPDCVLALPRSEVSGLMLDAQERGTWPIALCHDLLDLAAVDEFEPLELLAPSLPVGIDVGAFADDALLMMRHRLASRSWALGTRGGQPWRTLGLAAALGGGLRVGFDYGRLLPDGTDASSNAELVAAAVRLLRAVGSEPDAPSALRARLAVASSG